MTDASEQAPRILDLPIGLNASGTRREFDSLGQVAVVVDFSVSATDSCGPAPVTCNHPPGSLFIPGLTPVTCTATDPSGNSASCNFGVRVTVNASLP